MKKQMEKVGKLIRNHKKPTFLILLCVCILSTAMGLYHLTEKEITIIDGHEEKNIVTRKNTIGEVFQEQKIPLQPEDIVSPSLNEIIEQGMEIEIRRAVPIIITADGKEYKIVTAKTNVGEIINDAGLNLDNVDRVTPSRNSEVDEDKSIQIVRIQEEIIEEETTLSYSTQNNPTQDLDKGERKLVQQGEDGLKKSEVKITYEDGKEAKREIVGEKVIIEPRDEVIQVGINDTIRTSRGAAKFEKTMTVTATAYTENDPGVNNTTSVGARLQRGVIAVDPRVIPYYTKMYVPGYGFGQALDTGGAIKGNRIDLAMDSTAEALRYGRRNVKIYLLSE